MLSDLEGRSFENKDKYNGSGFVTGIKINQSHFYFIYAGGEFGGALGEMVGKQIYEAMSDYR
ncbi:hypothetical protein D3C87_1223900 [compost metagenome]